MIDTTSIIGSLNDGLLLALQYWWTWLPVLLGVAAYGAWFDYKRAAFIAGIKWVMLDVLAPPEVLYSSPRAAENIFAGLHASYAGFPGTSWKSQFFQGKVPTWFSFETVSNGGETHFHIRCTEEQRNVVESLIFSQYPDAEIRVVPDYIDLLPEKYDPANYDIVGAELEFTKDSPAYPIKTYIEFEEAGGKDEYARLDPLAPLLEIMSALRPGEHLWVQYLIRATGGDWAKEAEKLVDKLKGKKEESAKDPLEFIMAPIDQLLGAEPAEPKKEEKKEFNLQNLSPVDKKVLEAVQFKLAKLAFKVGIRILYTARKESFNGSRIASVTAMFKQLYYTNLNTFKPAMTRDKGMLKWLFPDDVGFFSAAKTMKKKNKMYGAYRNRSFPRKGPKEMLVYLNTEEMATLWHLPGLNVKAPMLPRVQAKKGQPPAILPTR